MFDNHIGSVSRLTAVLACACFCIVLGTVAVPAAAALRERPARTWMTDGKVFALVRTGNMLIIGGRFAKLLPPRGSDVAPIAVTNLAALDAVTGEPLPFSPRVSGPDAQVRALAVADGRLYVGGSFSRLGGSVAQNIGAVRLADGGRVGSFAPSVRGPVYALLANAQRLYAGGAFGRVDGAPRGKLAAWEMPGGALSTTWRPKTTSGAVRDLEFDASRGSIFIAGAFSAMSQGGSQFQRRTLAKVDAANGRLRGWKPAKIVGDPQTAWALDATRRDLHGGFGRGANYAASFRARGRTGDRRWRYATTGNVQSVELSIDGSRLFVGGHFGLNGRPQRVCGRQVRGLLTVDPRTGAPKCSWVPRLAPFQRNFQGVWAAVVMPGGLWVSGGWRSIGGLEQRNLAFFPR